MTLPICGIIERWSWRFSEPYILCSEITIFFFRYQALYIISYFFLHYDFYVRFFFRETEIEHVSMELIISAALFDVILRVNNINNVFPNYGNFGLVCSKAADLAFCFASSAPLLMASAPR